MSDENRKTDWFINQLTTIEPKSFENYVFDIFIDKNSFIKKKKIHNDLERIIWMRN